jgi:DNA-binding NarL/FixJ family response regulator
MSGKKPKAKIMLQTLPCYFHPTPLIFVDDDSLLLDSMQTRLHSRFNIKKFYSPTKAIDFIKKYQDSPKIKNCSDLCIQYSEDFVIEEKRPAVMNLAAMAHHLLNPKRFEIISVIVVDFAMPDMTGVEFFEKINALDCKKIMFTGEAWNIEGLNLFNFNMIDRISRKSEPAHIMLAIFEAMQLQYFQEHTQSILSALKNLSLVTPQCLQDPDLTSPIFELLKSKNIAEFYLINHEGVFLTATDKGELGLFMLQSEKEYKANPHPYSRETLSTPKQNYQIAFGPLPPEQKFSLKPILSFDQIPR